MHKFHEMNFNSIAYLLLISCVMEYIVNIYDIKITISIQTTNTLNRVVLFFSNNL